MPVNRFTGFVFCCSLLPFISLGATPPNAGFVKMADGIIIYPNAALSGGAKAVKLRVVTDKIIRVTASPLITFPDVRSLIAVYTSTAARGWTVEKRRGSVWLKTGSFAASVLLPTDAVSFFNKDGFPLLMERQQNGRSLKPAVFEGQPSYSLNQTS